MRSELDRQWWKTHNTLVKTIVILNGGTVAMPLANAVKIARQFLPLFIGRKGIPMQVFEIDGKYYCRKCALTKNPEAEPEDPAGLPSLDVPASCEMCRIALDCPLTRDGIEYALETLREAIQFPDDWGKPASLPAYEGKRAIDALRDLADNLLDHQLSTDDRRFVDRFLRETEPETPVIFRRWSDGTVDAYFPTIPADKAGEFISCYSHIGQHSSAQYQSCVERTEPATPEQFGPLAEELKGRGYNLKVYERMTPQLRREFAKNLQEQRDAAARR